MCNTSDLRGVKALGGISYHPEPFSFNTEPRKE